MSLGNGTNNSNFSNSLNAAREGWTVLPGSTVTAASRNYQRGKSVNAERRLQWRRHRLHLLKNQKYLKTAKQSGKEKEEAQTALFMAVLWKAPLRHSSFGKQQNHSSISTAEMAPQSSLICAHIQGSVGCRMSRFSCVLSLLGKEQPCFAVVNTRGGAFRINNWQRQLWACRGSSLLGSRCTICPS